MKKTLMLVLGLLILTGLAVATDRIIVERIEVDEFILDDRFAYGYFYGEVDARRGLTVWREGDQWFLRLEEFDDQREPLAPRGELVAEYYFDITGIMERLGE